MQHKNEFNVTAHLYLHDNRDCNALSFFENIQWDSAMHVMPLEVFKYQFLKAHMFMEIRIILSKCVTISQTNIIYPTYVYETTTF